MRNSFILFSLFLFLISCSDSDKNIRRYEFNGAIREIAADSTSMRIEHGDIIDKNTNQLFMESMTMNFPVENIKVIKGLKEGDSISGILAIDSTHGWIDQTTFLGKAALKTKEITLKTPEYLKTGMDFPDFTLTNQNGNKINLSDYKGKLVLFTFMFTNCPMPDFCIRMSSSFEKIQRKLSADKSLNGKWHLISISFDTKRDTPEILKSYSKSYTKDLTTWDFVTGADSVISQIANSTGMIYIKGENGNFDHNLSTVIIDPAGKLNSITTGNTWKPEEMVEKIKEVLGKK